jgi:rubrerythrin
MMASVLHCNTPNSKGINMIEKIIHLMTNSNEYENLAGKNQLPWMLISLGTVVILSLVLPFPVGFLASIVVLFSLNIIRAEIMLRKAGMGGIKGYYKSFSSLESGKDWGVSNTLYKPLTFSCMNCGYVHKKIACPKCGSKAVKVS